VHIVDLDAFHEESLCFEKAGASFFVFVFGLSRLSGLAARFSGEKFHKNLGCASFLLIFAMVSKRGHPLQTNLLCLNQSKDNWKIWKKKTGSNDKLQVFCFMFWRHCALFAKWRLRPCQLCW
jgi:hypothetical protein